MEKKLKREKLPLNIKRKFTIFAQISVGKGLKAILINTCKMEAENKTKLCPCGKALKECACYEEKTEEIREGCGGNCSCGA